MFWIKKFFASFHRSRVGGSLSEELRFHLEKEIELNIARGMPPDEARRKALIAFGGVQQTREAVSEQGSLHLLQSAFQDFRYGSRMMRKTPGFAAIAVSILALGIGANAAIFSAVNAILFARWPIPKQQQLVMIKEPSPSTIGVLASVPDFEDFRQRQTTFQQLSLWVGKSINLTGQERPDRLIGAFVSDNFFDMLGVRATTGRTFLPGEDKPGASAVAVISYGVWQTRFGADPHMLGRKLILNNELYEVVGILPRDFMLPVSPSEVFLTVQHQDSYSNDRRIRPFLVFGRLKDGVSREQAAADLKTIAQDLAREYPLGNTGLHGDLIGLQELTTQRLRTPLFVLLGAVALVLLIVCANLGNLLLARGAARQREIAVRAALGAARGRLARQLLSESMLLSAFGGLGGIMLAQLVLRLLVKIAPVDVELSNTAVLDVRVLAFTAAVSMLTALLFGMAPALQFSRLNLSPALAGGNRALGQPSRSRLRSAFVVFQVAISLVLVVSATLLVKSFHSLLMTDPGFTPDHLLSMEYRLPPTKYRTAEAQWNFHRRMLDRVQSVPGVNSAAIVQTLPFSGNWGQSNFKLPGQPASDQQNGVTAFYNAVTPEYFSTIGIPLLSGRVFSAHDDAGSPAVALVNRTFAERYFRQLDPIGQQVEDMPSDPLALAAEHGVTKRAVIIGVVGSARQRNVREELEPQVYFTYAQLTGIFGTLVARTAGDPISMTEAVRQAVWSVDKDQPVWKIRSMDSLIKQDTAPDRFAMFLMSALSALALLLTALGTYGMLSNMVAQRTRELGVRLALGAPSRSLVKLVLAQGLWLLALGSGLGLAGAIISGRFIRSLLYGVTPLDSSSFAVGLAAMAMVGLLACYLPARRATRVDPLVALREE